MATAKLKVQIQGRFSKGEKVLLYAARGDTYNPAQLGRPIKHTKAGDGMTEFDELEPGRYFAVSEDGARHALVTAKLVRTGKPSPVAGLFPGELARAPGKRVDRDVVEGARSTSSLPHVFDQPDEPPAEKPKPKPAGKPRSQATVRELRAAAKKKGVTGASRMSKDKLIAELRKKG